MGLESQNDAENNFWFSEYFQMLLHKFSYKTFFVKKWSEMVSRAIIIIQNPTKLAPEGVLEGSWKHLECFLAPF